mgnify:CR=1 FL=1
MPATAAPVHVAPATKSADAAAVDVGSLESLVAFVAQNEAGPTETDSELKPAAAEAETVPSQPETASDGADGEVEGKKLEAETPEADPETEPEASAEEDGKPATAETEAEGEKLKAQPPASDDPDALEEWLATLPKAAARKLRAQHRQLGDLKRELSDLKAKQPEVTTQQSQSAPVKLPLENVIDVRELDKLEQQAQAKLDSAEGALDAVDELREEVEFDPEGVRQKLKAAGHEVPEDREGQLRYLRDLKARIKAERAESDRLVKAAPKRRQQLEAEVQASRQAAAHYPWLESREGPDYELFSKVIESRPQIRQLGPDWQFAAAVFVEGLKTLNARTAAKATAAKVMAKAPPVPPKQPSKPSAAPRAAQGSAARSRFEETGSVDDLAAAIAARGI